MTGETYILKLAIDDTAIKNLEQKLSQIMGLKTGSGGSSQGSNSSVAQNLLKLTAIAAGVGSVVTLVKKIADATVSSSPMLQQMLKLMDSSISLILRPIGDFFGFILRPIMILLLQYAVLPFYRTFYPLARDYGTAIGQFFTVQLRTIIDWFTQNPLLGAIVASALAGLGLAGLFAGVVGAVNLAASGIIAAIKSVACPCDKTGPGTPSPPVIPVPPYIPPPASAPAPSPSNPKKITVSLTEGGLSGNTSSSSSTTSSSVKTSNSPLPNLGASSNTGVYQYLKGLAIATPTQQPNNPDNSILAGNNPLLQRITAMESTIQSWVASGLQSLSSLPAALQKQLQALPAISNLGSTIGRPIVPDVFADTGSSSTPQVNVTIGGNVYGVADLESAIANAVQKSFNRGAH